MEASGNGRFSVSESLDMEAVSENKNEGVGYVG